MNILKSIVFALIAIIFLNSCSNDKDLSDNVDSTTMKSNENEEVTGIAVSAYLEDFYGEALSFIKREEIVNEDDELIIISSYQSPINSNIEIFATSNKQTGDIIDHVQLNWETQIAEITDVYWGDIETSDLSVEGIEFIQGDDFIQAAFDQSQEQQNVVAKSRVRGFGWTCGPVVDLPGGSFRTCCHRIFWRRTQPCNQYGSGSLPGRNARIVNISQ
jgi:PBP1b-binding outer membrane lipoprotein LpoB